MRDLMKSIVRLKPALKHKSIFMRILLGLLLSFACLSGHAEDNSMIAFIDGLMARMTVQEKIGQLNLLPASTITTGAEKDSPLLDLIAQGKLGAILNMKGFEDIRIVQETAVKKSRLGIPPT